MSVLVHIPTPLRPFVEDRDRVDTEPGTVTEVLERLTNEYTKLRAHLLQQDGRLRNFVNVYVNDRDIRDLDGEETRVVDGDEISIVPSIAGGSAPTDTALPELSHEELLRYSRHLILPEVGLEGQRRLKAARVALIGAGGLGSPASLYLAAAGVGTLGLVDFDVVDATNLQRQIVHGTAAVGDSKLDSAEARLNDLNPHVHIEAFDTRLTSENALEILRDFDVVLDGSDNFPTRYLVNDAAYLAGKPLVDGSILLFDGMASVFLPGKGCYRCLFPTPPPPGEVPSCAEAGVLGMLPGMVGTIQATETVKLIMGIGTSLSGRLLLIDALDMDFRTVKLRRNPECPLCGDNPTVTELIDYEAFCGAPVVAD